MLVHLIEIHHIFCYMLSYGLNIPRFLCPFCSWCAFGLFLVLAVTNTAALNTLVRLLAHVCGSFSRVYTLLGMGLTRRFCT